MIESGHLILTMMPSLYCKLDCPHCYLSKEQRKDKTILSAEDIKLICSKINHYYTTKNIKHKKIDFYWYGGEPTSMGVEYFETLLNTLNSSFDDSYKIKHILLSALVGVKIDEWVPLIKSHFNSSIQTSYDSTMRGDRYMTTWKKKVEQLNKHKIEVTTISVINSHIIKDGPAQTHKLLSFLGIVESGWLPFQKNTVNDITGAYNDLSPSMNDFSDFMIGLTDINRHSQSPFLIGEEDFIYAMSNSDKPSNMGLQTLFLLPDGVLCMPDYDKDNVEFLQSFGNILSETFEEILISKPKRDWNRRQVSRNTNKECLGCDHQNYCLMEFWKNNTQDDDCYGAANYIDWLFKNPTNKPVSNIKNFS